MVTPNPRGRKSRRKGRGTAAVLDSREEILEVATAEFAQHGLAGARVDDIADRTSTSKRMIYYHFKSKDGLYRAVLERCYAGIRSLDSQVDLEALDPRAAIRRIVEITFDHHADHPHFVRLVAVENITQARNMAKLPGLRKRNAGVIDILEHILRRGQAEGHFRHDTSALDLHLLISALCFFRVSNRYTFGYLFDCDLVDAESSRRHREMSCDVVARYLEARPTA